MKAKDVLGLHEISRDGNKVTIGDGQETIVVRAEGLEEEMAPLNLDTEEACHVYDEWCQRNIIQDAE